MPLTIAEVLDAARQHGIGRLPEQTRLEVVRVWPTGMPSQWIAELGEPPSNWPVGTVFETAEEATQAGMKEGTKLRVELADALRKAGATETVEAQWEPIRINQLTD